MTLPPRDETLYSVEFLRIYQDGTWDRVQCAYSLRSLGWRNEDFIAAYMADNPVITKPLLRVVVHKIKIRGIDE